MGKKVRRPAPLRAQRPSQSLDDLWRALGCGPPTPALSNSSCTRAPCRPPNTHSAPCRQGKVKKEKSAPQVDPLTALTNSFQVVQKVGEVFQDFHSAQLQQAMAMSQPLTREQSVSAQRSIGHVLAPPYDKAEHERLQQKVHELEEWQAQQQAQLRAKDEDALRTATQYRAEQARLQARHDEAAAAAAVAAAERSAEREVAEAARLEAEAARASETAVQAELAASRAQSALLLHEQSKTDAARRAEADEARAEAEAETREQLKAEIEGYKAKAAKTEEKVGALSKLIETKNEVVWALLQQQSELKAENETHCANFEAYSQHCQQEFQGWISLNEQLEGEINEYKRADMETRVIIKRMHEELEHKRLAEAAAHERIRQLEETVLQLKR